MRTTARQYFQAYELAFSAAYREMHAQYTSGQGLWLSEAAIQASAIGGKPLASLALLLGSQMVADARKANGA